MKFILFKSVICTELISQKKWNTSQQVAESDWSTFNQALAGGPRTTRRTGRATRAWKRPVKTSSTINWESRSSLSTSAKHHHLEEGEKVGKVGVGKDHHCQEGGEATMEDMRTRPKQFHQIKKGPNIIERLKLK